MNISLVERAIAFSYVFQRKDGCEGGRLKRRSEIIDGTCRNLSNVVVNLLGNRNSEGLYSTNV
jgi:hypothetical protein